MVNDIAKFFESDTVKPSLEIGAFEALWANSISSFKQLHNKLTHSNHRLLSSLIDKSVANKFFDETIKRLYAAGVQKFNVKVDGTIDYPEKLHDADYPLSLLYYQGNWDLVFSPGVAVVGTRHPSPMGVERTKKLVRMLVDENYTIYSGLASGIDTAAHKAAIEYGGATVAVIGTPLSHCYPKENKLLQENIAKNFLLISQVPVLSYDRKAIKFTRLFFPERNKTMSALSKATVIVEAGETSGTLIQARAAIKQGRKVFILNNNFENPDLTWPHKLEKLGAIRVRNFQDILKGLPREINAN